MLIQRLSGHCLRSRPAPGTHALTDLPALAIARFIVLPRQELTVQSPPADPVTIAAPPPPSMAAVQAAYRHLPLSFEANKDQVDPHVQFLTRGHGHTLFLTPSDETGLMSIQAGRGPPCRSSSPLSGTVHSHSSLI
ncbi:MAG: hypothetical protein AAB177_13495 [Nitrospirota bacterium]|jgi:hypothetical protein